MSGNTYPKINLAGLPEANPPMVNLLDGCEAVISAQTHYDDDSRHVNFGERKKWNESLISATDYTDYQFMSIIGQFNFADNTKTLAEIVKEEIDERTKLLNQEIADRKAAIEKEITDRTNAINDAITKEVAARTAADSNEATTRSNQISSLINNLYNGNVSPLTVNGIRITMGTSVPRNPTNNGDIFLETSEGKLFYYSGGWHPCAAMYF